MEIFSKIVVFFIWCFVLSPLMRGYTLQTLWGWFISSQFGLAALTLAQSIGINTLITFLVITNRTRPYEENTPKDSKPYWSTMVVNVGNSVTLCCIVLLFGYVCKFIFLN